MSGGFDGVLARARAAVGVAYPAAALGILGGGERVTAALGAATLATWFDLASLTKPLVTALLCLRLVESRQLALDEVVLPASAGGPPVSVRMLLRHTSGLPAWLPLHAQTSEVPEAERRAAIIEAARRAERGPAGERAVYSDLGFILLGALIEERAGARLDALIAPLYAALGAELAYRPLDRASPDPVAAERCARTHSESQPRVPLRGIVHDDNARAMRGVAGHAGLFGTLAGVLRLAEVLLACYHGDAVAAARLGVSAALLREAWAVAPGSSFGLGWDHPEPLRADGTSGSSAGRLFPRTAVGHLGYTGCSLWLAPALPLVVVLLSNRVDVETPEAAAGTQAAIKKLRPELHDAVIEALSATTTCA